MHFVVAFREETDLFVGEEHLVIEVLGLPVVEQPVLLAQQHQERHSEAGGMVLYILSALDEVLGEVESAVGEVHGVFEDGEVVGSVLGQTGRVDHTVGHDVLQVLSLALHEHLLCLRHARHRRHFDQRVHQNGPRQVQRVVQQETGHQHTSHGEAHQEEGQVRTGLLQKGVDVLMHMFHPTTAPRPSAVAEASKVQGMHLVALQGQTLHHVVVPA